MRCEHSNRNPIIELFRFIATICIMLYHYEYLYIGHPVFLENFYIFVEAFFVLSGFFLAKNMACKKQRIIEYVMKEFRKLYPKYIGAFVISFFVLCITTGIKNPGRTILPKLLDSLPEITLSQMTGFWGSSSSNIIGGGAPEYISVLLLCLPIVGYLVRDHRKLFVNIIGPLAIIVGYSRILSLYGNLSQWMVYDGFFTMGFIRGFAGISLGALGYLVLSRYLDQVSKNIRIIAIVVPIFFIFMLFCDMKPVQLIIYPFLFAVFIAALSGTNVYANICKNEGALRRHRIYNCLGSISYDIFLLHTSLILIFKYAVNGCFSVLLFIIWFTMEILIASIYHLLFKRVFIVRK